MHNEPPNGPPNSTRKIARVENVPECLARLQINECPDIDVRRSFTHFESTQQIKAERYQAHVHQNGCHLAGENEYLSQRNVAYLKPSAYQTQPTSMPMTTGNPLHLAFSGIQSNASQLEPKYLTEIQNLRFSRTVGKPTHYPHPMWRNPGPDSVHSYSEVSPNLIRENRESDANSVKHQQFDVAVSNAILPTLPFSNSVMPSANHFLGGSDHYPVRQMAT